ncbi:MAG: DUF5320 domain-containing protein [Chlorobi bacterium]|nr:DUF5320 domain-containing protein [Chlorobiota bacterium]
MPGFDRTGPLGRGAMTGRRMGHCADASGIGNAFRGRGYGNGFGRRVGFGRDFYEAGISDVSEKTMLENEVNTLKDQLTFLEKRLSEIKDES